MDKEKENQNSTEQFYANVEESAAQHIVPNQEEEPSYSLEDLHPEESEESKPVAPPVSSSEEVQPDPTVIDGIKAPIIDTSAQNSQPAQRVPFSTNALEPTMAKQTAVHAAPPQVKKVAAQPTNDTPNAKVFYFVFGIILIVVLIGLPLYSSFKDDSSGTSETVNDHVNKTETPKENPNDNPTPNTPQNPTGIKFDMTLEFDKGLVQNEKEVKQKTGFLPTNLTGVIRCDMERPVVTEGITNYASTYLYYENYKLKSAITVTKQVYGDPAIYETNKDVTLVYKTAGDNNDSLDVEIVKDDENYTVTNIMQYNLQYGNSTYIEGLDTSLLFSSQFNTNIKTAMDNLLVTGASSGNAICGALDTTVEETTNDEAGL